MKTSIKLFFISFAFLLSASAQIKDTIISREVSVSYMVDLGSTGINNQMLYKLGLGGYISPAIIQKNHNNIANASTLGSYNTINANYTINYKNPDSMRMRLNSFSIQQISAQGFVFSRDLFGLVFQGNSPYLGRSLRLDNSHLQAMKYYSLDVGFQLPSKQAMEANKFQLISAKAGLALVTNLLDIKIKNGQLYTDTAGDFIIARLNSRISASNINYINGMGPSLGLVAKLNSNTYFEVSNVGFAYMFNTQNRKSSSQVNDVRINQVQITSAQLNNTSWAQEQADTILEKLLPPNVDSKPFKMLPFYLQIHNKISNKLTVDVNYLAIKAYIPQITGYYQILGKHSKIQLYGIGQLGGFDTYNIGLQSKFVIGRSIYVKTHIAGLEAIAFPVLTHGLGASASVTTTF